MKYVFFSGGLGNQMFQYAFMLSLKHKGIKVLADTSVYECTLTHNGFELDKIFNTSERFIKRNKIVGFIFKLLHRKRYPLLWFRESKPMVYDNTVYKTKKMFLDGCWVSELYFKGIEDVIRREFKFCNIST